MTTEPTPRPWRLSPAEPDGGLNLIEGNIVTTYAEAALIVRAVNERDELIAALQAAIGIAEEARAEWDAAPETMRAGKLLIALAGHIKNYRPDITAIHVALAKATAPNETPIDERTRQCSSISTN